MNAAVAAKNEMRAAFPLSRYGKLDNVFYQAVRFIAPRVEKTFTQRRARALWEGSARRVDSDEMDALRAAKYEEHRREQEELRARLASLDKMLAVLDAHETRSALAERGGSPD